MNQRILFRRYGSLVLAIGALTCLLAGRLQAGEFPVPWPPPGNTEPPAGNPPDTVPPTPDQPGTEQPPPVGNPPTDVPPIVVPPPGTGEPPAGSPPDVPPPEVVPPEVDVPPTTVDQTPEPASLVIGLFGVSAGLIAAHCKRRK